MCHFVVEFCQLFSGAGMVFDITTYRPASKRPPLPLATSCTQRSATDALRAALRGEQEHQQQEQQEQPLPKKRPKPSTAPNAKHDAPTDTEPEPVILFLLTSTPLFSSPAPTHAVATAFPPSVVTDELEKLISKNRLELLLLEKGPPPPHLLKP